HQGEPVVAPARPGDSAAVLPASGPVRVDPHEAAGDGVEGRWRMTIELIAVAMCSMVIHEWAHAAVADLEGDPVPRDMGRVTLNPFAHLDPFGTVLVPVVTYAALGIALGWCRPVPLGPWYLRRGRRSHALVLAA